MATNTSNTFLYYNSGTKFEKLVDIKTYPDMLSAPAKLPTTTLSDAVHTYIPDIFDVPDLTFTVNYEVTMAATLKGLESTEQDFQLRFGADGKYGSFDWSGMMVFTPTGGGVGAVREGVVTVYPSTAVTPNYTATPAPIPSGGGSG